MVKLEQRAADDLKNLLYNQTEWIKVHAAEFLLWQGIAADEVHAEFLKEEALHGDKPQYRIGIWRVLYQATKSPLEKEQWRDKIVAVFASENSPDRLHAIESLAKLSYAVHTIHPELLQSMLVGAETEPMTMYAHWNHAYADNRSFRQAQMYMLGIVKSKDRKEPITDHIASYIIRYLGKLEFDEWVVLRDAARSVHDNQSIKANLLATAWLTMPDSLQDNERAEVKASLFELHALDFKSVAPHLLMAIGGGGDSEDWSKLTDLYWSLSDQSQANYDADLHATASYAILTMISRNRAE